MSEIAKESTQIEKNDCDSKPVEESDHDPHYDPIISLPEVKVPTLEEDEIIMLTLRAKLYRYDSTETPPEWKERGTGTVKILRHKINDTVRVVMRRDKTLKLCANHFINPHMKLKPNASCERAWVYSVEDFSNATVKTEMLAIKFANIENAEKWKEVFEEAQKIVAKNAKLKSATPVDSPVEDKFISGDTPKLSDTFEEKKNSSSDKKEETEEKNENESTPEKKTSSEITEKISSMTIKSS